MIVDRHAFFRLFSIWSYKVDQRQPFILSLAWAGLTFEPMRKLHPIKALIFDFDGTLAVLNIDFSSMKERIFDLVRQHGVLEEAVRERYLLEIIDEVYQILWEKKPSRAGEFYQKAHSIIHEIELRGAESGRLMPGTHELLRTLRGQGIKIGIVTRNCEEAVRKVFPDIDAYCDTLISRDSIKKVKPHPDHLTSVLKILNALGEEAVMIGDHTIDIQAGKRVGMKTIGVLTGRTKREEFEKAGADYILREASEICALLEEQ
jgi:phosphoglycolate phosphatase